MPTTVILASIAAALVVSACRDPDPGETADALARAYVQATFVGDVPGARRLWATPPELDEQWVCDPDVPRNLQKRAASELESCTRGIFRWDRPPRFVDWDGERTVVRGGETLDGCTARRDVELERGDVGFTVTDADHPERTPHLEHHGLTLVRVRGHWRIIAWTP